MPAQQAQTLAHDFSKVYKVNDRCFVGLPGLASDTQTLADKFRFRVNLYKLREERDISPKTFATMASMTLYEKRFGPFFVEPIVAGLEGPNHEPFICSMDLIGAVCFANDFHTGGTAGEAMQGICESLWRPNMEPDELFEVAAQCLLAGTDRDCPSGWGGIVHVITPTEIITKTLKGRMD